MNSRARQLLGLLDRAEIAALGLEAQMSRSDRLGCIARQLEEVDQALVGEFQPIVGIEQRHAVAHVVEHRLHDAARLLERLLALLQLGDVAEHREDAAVADRLEAEFDVRPSSRRT